MARLYSIVGKLADSVAGFLLKARGISTTRPLVDLLCFEMAQNQGREFQRRCKHHGQSSSISTCNYESPTGLQGLFIRKISGGSYNLTAAKLLLQRVDA